MRTQKSVTLVTEVAGNHGASGHEDAMHSHLSTDADRPAHLRLTTPSLSHLSVIRTNGWSGSQHDSSERILIQNLDLSTLELHETLRLECFQGPADHFAGAAQFVGQCLMRRSDRRSLGDEQDGQSLIESAKRQFLHQGHHSGHALGKLLENKAPKVGRPFDHLLEEGSGNIEAR